MQARIYQPARNAMTSGQAKTRTWILEYAPQERRGVDPLMGWTSSGDMESQVRLSFPTREAAEDFARDKGLAYVVQPPQKRKPNLRAGGYGENFATKRRTVWTH